MANYTSFLITRNPFDRLVSAYYDKLTKQGTYDYYRHAVGRVIARNQASEYMHGVSLG